MGKKKRCPKKKTYYKPEPDGPPRKETYESFQRASCRIEEINFLPLEEKKRTIRHFLIETGTDVNRNDNDPYGDGDQSMIVTFQQRDLARQIFAAGGDIGGHFSRLNPSVSRLAHACASGNVDAAQTEFTQIINLESVSQPYSRNDKILKILEKRETSMRLSPLLLIVSAGKYGNGATQRHRDVAKLLMMHGANPIAKDVFGKTAVHYGSGTFGSKMTIEVAEMCISAAKSHHLFGKDVELHSLKKQSMNGKVGVAGGLDPDTGRRSVYLQEEEREVWIKVENISLTEKDKDCKIYPLLSDVQDRFGSTALHELCMTSPSTQMSENVKAAELLLKKYRTSIYTTDADGKTPFQLVYSVARLEGVNGVAQLVMEEATLQGREARVKRKEEEHICAKCEKNLDKSPPVCAKCMITHYCSKNCQVSMSTVLFCHF